MKKIVFTIASLLMSASVLAAGGGNSALMKHVDVNPTDTKSLQNGAKLFVNYCLGCHSASFMRYQRVADDLNIDYTIMQDNLMFTGDKIGDVMSIAMPAEDAAEWFGTAPPDLTLTARAKTPDWVYSYLLAFYKDDKKPTGVNNAIFKDVSMPHVLWELQGVQVPVYETRKNAKGEDEEVIVGFELEKEGQLSPEDFASEMRDLVNFMAYMGEPARAQREALGVKVILFLLFMFGVFYLLKKEYWKDIH